jgi:hypothetical protein
MSLTFQQAIAKRGLKDPQPRSVKWHNAHQSRKENRALAFPDDRAVCHRALVEAQAPGFTFVGQEPGDDGPVFSSKGLTDWYVREFIHSNHLKA